MAAVPLRAAPSLDAVAVSELLLGESFAVVDIAGAWAWGYSCHDHYVGYLPPETLGDAVAATHIVATPAALRFLHADIKAPVVDRLPMGARVAGTEVGSFIETVSGFIHRRHVRPVDTFDPDAVAIAERLIGAPYRWGGRSGDGVDCSGLVQLALELAGVTAPRDSDQQAALGAPVADGAPLVRGDLIVLPGHIGMMVDGERMIHANAHWMAVTVELLAEVIARIAATHPDPIVARRRLGG